MNRRRFLILSGLAVAAAGLGSVLSKIINPDAIKAGEIVLKPEHKPFVLAAMRSILQGVLPSDAAKLQAALEGNFKRFETSIKALHPKTQADIKGLLDMFGGTAGRYALAGIKTSWDEASVQDTSAFLQQVRLHSVAQLRPAYQAMHDLCLGAWYSADEHWAAIGYGNLILQGS